MIGDGLPADEIYPWIALRKVSDGGVTRLGDQWLDGGREVPDYITTALAALLDDGSVALAPSEFGGMPRAVLTAAGAERFEGLCQLAMGISAARFIALTWPGHADPAPEDSR